MSISLRLGGILKTATMWGIAWATTGIVFGLGVWLMIGRPSPTLELWRLMASLVLLWTVWGALSGTVFAALLIGAERKRTLEQLSAARTAFWGAAAGMTLPLVTYALWFLYHGVPMHGLLSASAATAVSGALGAAIAAANLDLTRRLPTERPRPPSLGSL